MPPMGCPIGHTRVLPSAGAAAVDAASGRGLSASVLRAADFSGGSHGRFPEHLFLG